MVSRLSLYLRELQQLSRSGHATISSSKLGRRLGVTDAQVRKDFAYFGQFGYPGIGYKCDELSDQIRKILGTDQIWPVALVGCGNLGQALLGYRGFSKQGFEVVAAFDIAADLVGNQIEGIPIHHLDDLAQIRQQHHIQIAILAVPAAKANLAVAHIVDAGITGIMNFAPVTLSIPKNVNIVEVDLAKELEQLSFAVTRGTGKS